MRSILDDNTELSISSGLVDSQLLSLQREVEDWFTGARKQVYKYDQFLDIQRKQIYRLRRHILTSSEHELMHLIFTYIRADVGEIVQKHAVRHPKHWNVCEMCNEVEDLVNEEDNLFSDSFANDLEAALAQGSWMLAKEHRYPTSSSYLFAYKAAGQNSSGFAIDQISEKRKASEERWSPELSFVVNEITEHVLSNYFSKLRVCAALRRGMSTVMSEQRSRMLTLIDQRWKKHLKHMETLRNSVSLRVFGQLDPLEEYKVDSARALMVLINSIQREIVREIFDDLREQI
jgi:preprotein translocase subunit SecA